MTTFLRENTTGIENDGCLFSCNLGKEAIDFCFEVKDEDLISPFSEDNEDLWQGDAVEVFLSPDGDPTHYFELEVSPFGLRFWGEIINPDGQPPRLKKLPPVFDAEVRRTEEGYHVRIELAYRALGAAAPDEMTFNAFRLDKKADGRQLLYALSPTFCESFHRPKYFLKFKEVL